MNSVILKRLPSLGLSPGVAIGIAALTAFLVAAGVAWYCPFAPRIHDEFSYLLGADTLLHGRLANPTPDLWQPFQSFHVIMQPTYASKYPLGQSIFTALGIGLCGQPLAGCWLAAALCAGSITWMLMGATSQRWALFGGLLVAVSPAMQVTWSQCLLSGWLTASGCSLLTGGILRLRRRVRFRASLVAGSGVALLALTRPFEGLIACMLCGSILWMAWSAHGVRERLVRCGRIGSVSAWPIALALAAIAAQNLAVTGRLSRLPYTMHEQQYSPTPVFVFGQPRVPELTYSDGLSQVVHDFHHVWSLDSYRARVGWWGWLRGIGLCLRTLSDFWGLWIVAAVASLPAWWSQSIVRYFGLAVIVQVLASSSVCWVFPHYLAPLLPWLVLLSVLGMRRVLRWCRSRLQVPSRTASSLPRYALLGSQLFLLLPATVSIANDPQRAWASRRAAIEADLQSRPGQHLVIVVYGAGHNFHQEWVYNKADLDGAKVLWARGEREQWSAALLKKYASTRHIWRLDVGPGLAGQPERGEASHLTTWPKQSD